MQRALQAMMEQMAPLELQVHREATEQTVLPELREQQALLVTMALTGPLEQRVQLAITELMELPEQLVRQGLQAMTE